MNIQRISELRISVIIVAVASLLSGCSFGSSGSKGLEDVSYTEFEESEAAKWIALPSDADDISTFNYFGFDTNHRFLKATLGSTSPVLPSLLTQSVQIQPRKPGATFVAITKANITYEAFSSLFLGAYSPSPTWWKTDFSRFDQQSYCAWETTNNYGYGYIYLYDSEQKELRAFQWSQQWNTVEATLNTLHRGNADAN